MSDTTWFDMRDTNLQLALQIAFDSAPGRKAWGYKSTKDRLVFAWNSSAGKDFVPFVVPIGVDQAIHVVQDWCEHVADYGRGPDTDGDASRSWRVFCENWGYVDHNHYTFAAVEPFWAVYGK